MSTEKGPMIARGRTAEIFLWKDNQVLKLFLDWCPATDVEREARNTQAAHKVGLPVPAVERIVEVEGRMGIVFERIQGRSMSDTFAHEPWKLFQLARVMAELHATMHSYELPELPSRRERLEDRIRAVAALPTNTKEAVLKVLSQLPDGNAVCHGDFYVDNIIVSPRGPVIIDWLDATQGNPVADVARTSLLFQTSEAPPSIAGRWLVNWTRRLFYSTYLKRYLRLRPASREQIAAWQLPVAAARLDENIPEEKQRLLAFVEAKLKAQGSHFNPFW